MSRYNTPSIFDEISTFKDCEAALLTTFNFDISFFDHSILPLLVNKHARICVFADAKQFQESISKESSSNEIGRHYFVQPFRMDKSFHPKLILLLAKNRAKLIVASANLTYSSYYSNNEIFQSFSYDDTNKQYINLFVWAFDFFKKISKESNQYYLDSIIDYCNSNYQFLIDKNDNLSSPFLLTSYSESIIGQVIKSIDEEIKEIKVATPFYDDELTALQHLKRKYPNSKIELYIQNCHSTFPVDKYSDQLINEVNVFEKVNNNEHPQKQFYHGKVFCFISDIKEYVLYGSPNFSASALLNSYKNGGNLEAAIFDFGELGDFSTFFNSFILEKDFKIDELKTGFDNKETSNDDYHISFVNGEIYYQKVKVLIKTDIDLYKCNIKLNDFDNIKIDIESKNDNIYTIRFPNVLDCNIFDMSFTDEEQTIVVRCFACNIDCLNDYVNSTNRNPFSRLNSEEDMEKYKKDDFLRRFSDITSDIRMGIQDKKRNINIEQTDVNDDTEEGESEEDSELDSILYESSDYVITIGNHEIYSKASAYLSYYAERASLLLGKKGVGHKKLFKKTKDAQESEADKKERAKRKQSFSNSLLRYFEDYADINNKKLNGLDFEFYFNLYELFSETYICDLYIDKIGIRDLPRLIETKINYITNRLIPNIDTQVQESDQFEYLKKEIALLCIECYYAKNNLPNNVDIFKEELLKLDRLLANTFIDELEKLIKEVCSILDINMSIYVVDYYKKFFINSQNIDELKSSINKYFGFVSSCLDTKFNPDTLCLNISISEAVKKESAQIQLKKLDRNLVDVISGYMKRYYGNVLSNDFSFVININNYNEFISNLYFEWTSKDYNYHRRVITYSNPAIEPRPDRISLISDM